MKKIKIHKIVRITGLIALCLGLGYACTGDFLKINTNPYQPTDNDMHGDNCDVGGFFTQLEQNVVPLKEYQLAQNLVGDLYSGFMAQTNNFNNNQSNSTYFFQDGWLDKPFGGVYAQEIGAWVNTRKKVIARGDVDVDQSDIFQLSQIIKIASLSRLTDLWGPMPYSKAGAGGLATPYDSQEVIYNQFFSELDKAEVVLSKYITENPGVKPLAQFDLVYGGDYVQWLKFANSLRLRFAMRIVYAAPELARKEAEKAVKDPVGLITKNADNATLKSGNGIIINNPVETMWHSYGDSRAGANIISVMNGYNDPRRPAYFQLCGLDGYTDKYIGIRSGIAIGSKDTYLPYSAQNILYADPIVWMAAAEVSFLKAEGALRGWDMGISAQAAYEQGVNLSFEQHGAGNATNYLADDTSLPADYVSPSVPAENIKAVSKITIKWNETDNFQTKLERIITQKWIALYPDGQEAWSEFRRTGYPRLFPVMVSYDSDIPNTPTRQIARYPFPNSEYALNANNLQKAIQLLGGPDKASTHLWWDKNPEKPQQ